MTFALFNWQAAALLDYLASGNAWLAAHTADPTPALDPSTELFGGGYERQSLTWEAVSGRSLLNSNSLIFWGVPAYASVKYLVAMTQKVGGNGRACWDLSASPLTPASSGQILVGPHDLALTL